MKKLSLHSRELNSSISKTLLLHHSRPSQNASTSTSSIHETNAYLASSHSAAEPSRASASSISARMRARSSCGLGFASRLMRSKSARTYRNIGSTACAKLGVISDEDLQKVRIEGEPADRAQQLRSLFHPAAYP